MFDIYVHWSRPMNVTGQPVKISPACLPRTKTVSPIYGWILLRDLSYLLSSFGVLPARTSSTIWLVNSAGYCFCELDIVDSCPPKDCMTSMTGQLQHIRLIEPA